MPSSAFGSALQSMPRHVCENVSRGVLGRVLRVYLAVSCELTLERTSSRLGVYNQV